MVLCLIILIFVLLAVYALYCFNLMNTTNWSQELAYTVFLDMDLNIKVTGAGILSPNVFVFHGMWFSGSIGCSHPSPLFNQAKARHPISQAQ